jgi:Ca2+-binding RTX toxin-like protein
MFNLAASTFSSGTSSDETLTGTTGADMLLGNRGTDTISGGNGSDTVYGGYGADSVDGGAGNDIIGGDMEYFTPNSLGNLQLWLDAWAANGSGAAYSNGGTVSVWDNIVEGGPNGSAVTGSPIFRGNSNNMGGRPTVEFNANSAFDLGVTQLGNTSLFADSKQQFSVFASYYLDNAWDYGTLVGRAGGAAANRTFQWLTNNDKYQTHINGSNTNNIFTTTSYSNDIGGIIWNGSGITALKDGASNTSVTVGTAAEEATQRIIVGGRSNGTGYLFDGQMHEVLIYDRALTTAEYQLVEDYLALRSNIALTSIGGFGVDTLTGGTGNDTFVWGRVSYSGIGAGNRDIITDFKSGGDADKIDISGLFRGSGSFIGNAAFDANAATREIRAYQDGSNAILAIDWTGDGNTDMEIQLDNYLITSLTASDFLF